MNTSRKMLTLVLLLVTVVGVWYVVEENREMIEIVSQQDKVPVVPSIGSEQLDPGNLDFDKFESFFVEYRLQRDRVRANEQEMLTQMINNPNVSPEAKKQAEEQYLAQIKLMEQELMVENMLKANGYKDAIFFLKAGAVNVVVQADSIGEKEFLQIAEIVSSVTGVAMDKIAVTEHNNK